MVDPRLECEYDLNSAWKAVETALACTPPRSIERPIMNEVVAELKNCLGAETATERIKSLNIKPVHTTYDISSYPQQGSGVFRG